MTTYIKFQNIRLGSYYSADRQTDHINDCRYCVFITHTLKIDKNINDSIKELIPINKDFFHYVINIQLKTINFVQREKKKHYQ